MPVRPFGAGIAFYFMDGFWVRAEVAKDKATKDGSDEANDGSDKKSAADE